MKELIKPNKNEITYDDNVIGLCGELRDCTIEFSCRSSQSADMDDDEILF